MEHSEAAVTSLWQPGAEVIFSDPCFLCTVGMKPTLRRLFKELEGNDLKALVSMRRLPPKTLCPPVPFFLFVVFPKCLLVVPPGVIRKIGFPFFFQITWLKTNTEREMGPVQQNITVRVG